MIEQTIRETLPPGFQRSEFLVEKGMVDQVVARKRAARGAGLDPQDPDDGPGALAKAADEVA